MTRKTQQSSVETSETGGTAVPGPDDPRSPFAAVTSSLGDLIAGTEALGSDALAAKTPCPDFAVSDLLDHIIMVVRRVSVIGNGGHWSEVQQDALGSGWADAYRAGAHDIMAAWTDSAKLGQIFQVPWGEMPGALLLLTYTAELAVHGWDLATATGQEFAIDDHHLHGALTAAKFIPAEGRESAEIPFSPVVEPGEGASVLLQLAGWMGRDVLAAA